MPWHLPGRFRWCKPNALATGSDGLQCDSQVVTIACTQLQYLLSKAADWPWQTPHTPPITTSVASYSSSCSISASCSGSASSSGEPSALGSSRLCSNQTSRSALSTALGLACRPKSALAIPPPHSPRTPVRTAVTTAAYGNDRQTARSNQPRLPRGDGDRQLTAQIKQAKNPTQLLNLIQTSVSTFNRIQFAAAFGALAWIADPRASVSDVMASRVALSALDAAMASQALQYWDDRGVAGVLHATARLASKGFACSSSALLLQELMHSAAERKFQGLEGMVSCSWLLWSLAKLQGQTWGVSKEQKRHVIDAVQQLAPQLIGRLTQQLTSFFQLSKLDPDHPKMPSLLLTDPQALEQASWAAAELGVRDEAWWEAVVGAVLHGALISDDPRTNSAKVWNNTVWAVANSGYNGPLLEPLFKYIAQQVLQHRRWEGATAQHLSNVLWAFGQVKYYDPAAFSYLLRQLVRPGTYLNAEAVAMAVAACATCMHDRGEVDGFLRAVPLIVFQGMAPRQASNTLWAMSCLRCLPQHEPLVSLLLQKAAAEVLVAAPFPVGHPAAPPGFTEHDSQTAGTDSGRQASLQLRVDESLAKVYYSLKAQGLERLAAPSLIMGWEAVAATAAPPARLRSRQKQLVAALQALEGSSEGSNGVAEVHGHVPLLSGLMYADALVTLHGGRRVAVVWARQSQYLCMPKGQLTGQLQWQLQLIRWELNGRQGKLNGQEGDQSAVVVLGPEDEEEWDGLRDEKPAREAVATAVAGREAAAAAEPVVLPQHALLSQFAPAAQGQVQGTGQGKGSRQAWLLKRMGLV